MSQVRRNQEGLSKQKGTAAPPLGKGKKKGKKKQGAKKNAKKK